MAIITINAEFGSRGIEIAQKLAEELEYIYFDQIIADEIAYLIKTNKLNVKQFEEENHQNLFATLTKFFSIDIFTLKNNYSEEEKRKKLYAGKENVHPLDRYELSFKGLDAEVYKKMIYRVVSSLAKIGDCIIVGRGGNIILKGEPNTLHFRFIASKKFRIETLKRDKNFPNNEKEIEKILKEIDKKAYNYNKYYFNFDVNDPHYYSAVLNVEELGEDGIIKTIKCMVESL